MLRDLIRDSASTEIDAATIMAVTSEYFGVTMDELCGPMKTRAIASARQIAMYLCRELTDLSLPKIGQTFGGRDHTTVMHAEKKIREEIAERRQTYEQVQELSARIQQRARRWAAAARPRQRRGARRAPRRAPGLPAVPLFIGRGRVQLPSRDGHTHATARATCPPAARGRATGTRACLTGPGRRPTHAAAALRDGHTTRHGAPHGLRAVPLIIDDVPAKATFRTEGHAARLRNDRDLPLCL